MPSLTFLHNRLFFSGAYALFDGYVTARAYLLLFSCFRAFVVDVVGKRYTIAQVWVPLAIPFLTLPVLPVGYEDAWHSAAGFVW